MSHDGGTLYMSYDGGAKCVMYNGVAICVAWWRYHLSCMTEVPHTSCDGDVLYYGGAPHVILWRRCSIRRRHRIRHIWRLRSCGHHHNYEVRIGWETNLRRRDRSGWASIEWFQWLDRRTTVGCRFHVDATEGPSLQGRRWLPRCPTPVHSDDSLSGRTDNTTTTCTTKATGQQQVLRYYYGICHEHLLISHIDHL